MRRWEWKSDEVRMMWRGLATNGDQATRCRERRGASERGYKAYRVLEADTGVRAGGVLRGIEKCLSTGRCPGIIAP